MDDLTGFEITYLLELPQPGGIFVVWGLVLPLVYIVASSLTNLVLRDFLILKVRRCVRRAADFASCGIALQWLVQRLLSCSPSWNVQPAKGNAAWSQGLSRP